MCTLTRLGPVLFLGLLGSSPSIGQVTVETVAGGKILSGIPAQNVVLGQITGITRDAPIISKVRRPNFSCHGEVIRVRA